MPQCQSNVTGLCYLCKSLLHQLRSVRVVVLVVAVVVIIHRRSQGTGAHAPRAPKVKFLSVVFGIGKDCCRSLRGH